ncbi:MAG: LL-diaminopimelate aminotransferase [Sulfobacillus benefaciens]|uniref:Aminotransferase n=1 Tax=Sulfobacillus benefaciens TaxID=453960 RepID=A0A2T2XFC9_9FIRM|nr:MAG: LL-diaminopimelate aminotransferase [Sulfobacillus benefaciens]
MDWASRMDKIPPYLFFELDRIVEQQRQMGHDVINLGIGDPDMATAPHVVHAMQQAVADPSNHRYPHYLGSLQFRQAMADWYAHRFGVTLSPTDEVVALIGSKEGIAHLIWAFAEPGDVVLVPDPAYPVYYTQTLLAGAEPYYLPLLATHNFLPQLDIIPPSVLKRATMLWINYPNNPTGAIADTTFLQEAVAFCKQYDLLLCSDAAYVEMGFDGYRPPSVLEVEGAKDVAVEFYSFSKPFNMTGWRIGCAVGNSKAIAALGTLKSNLDSGPFTAVQQAAVAGLANQPEKFFDAMNLLYQKRRDIVIQGLRDMGLNVPTPHATFYLWFPTPMHMTSSEAAKFFVETAHVMVTPGAAYGPHGEGWLRISLTTTEDRLAEAMVRMKKALQSLKSL